MKRFTEIKGYQTPNGDRYNSLQEAAKFELIRATDIDVINDEIEVAFESIVENADVMIEVLQDYIDSLPRPEPLNLDEFTIKGDDE